MAVIYKNIEVGKKYRIKSWKVRPSHWNSAGLMDKYQGQIVTIRRITYGSVRIEEDQDDRDLRGGWSWNTNDFADPEIDAESDPNMAFLMKRR